VRKLLGVVCLGVALVGCLHAQQRAAGDDLLEVRRQTQAVLDRMDHDLAEAANLIGRNGRLTGEDTRQILRRYSLLHPFVVECATVSRRGEIVVAEPEYYKSLEGTSVGAQEQILRLHGTQRPVFSNTVLVVEETPAADLQQPVFLRDGSFLGSVSNIIRPSALLGDILTPHNSAEAEFWVMDSKGSILFDPVKSEIGRNVFRHPPYVESAEFQALALQMASQPTGSGVYTLPRPGMDPTTQKRCIWETVGLHGTEWRIALVQDIG
jgi:branched-chain amino acid transport system substrate-binding protein